MLKKAIKGSKKLEKASNSLKRLNMAYNGFKWFEKA